MKRHLNFSSLSDELMELAGQLEQVRAQAKQLGIFTDERELLECSKCGLKEDVDINGFLLTCFDASLGQDTGLRFTEETDTVFRCPNCGFKVLDLPDEQRLAKPMDTARRETEKRRRK